jgi:2-iminobutanoate/2-iminopropanoate deaminase
VVALQGLVMNAIKLVASPDVPRPAGHYSHATVHNGTIYVSGLLPIARSGPLAASASFDEQVEVVFDNLESILVSAQSNLEHILRTTIYITNIDHWPRFNELYATRFGTHKPARTVVPVTGLHYGYAIELDAIAAVIPQT